MVFMFVLAFVLVFGGLGCFPYTMSVMQRWISYSAKTLRGFLFAPKCSALHLTGLTAPRGVKLSPLGFCAPKGQRGFSLGVNPDLYARGGLE
jgi:hypothetical protein